MAGAPACGTALAGSAGATSKGSDSRKYPVLLTAMGCPVVATAGNEIEMELCPIVTVSAVVMVAVALLESVTVVTPTAVMAVLAGIPVPVMGCPTAAKATDDTEVSMLLPFVVMALKVAADLLV